MSRRLVGTPVNINNPDNVLLREPDGAAVFAKQGRPDYRLLAPTLEAVTPHNLHLLVHIFLDTDGTDVWFDRENEAGTEWGAVSAGVRLELTRNERGQNRPLNCRSRTAPAIRRRAVPLSLPYLGVSGPLSSACDNWAYSGCGEQQLLWPTGAGQRVVHIIDARKTDTYQTDPKSRERLEASGIRNWLAVALQKDKEDIVLLALITSQRTPPSPTNRSPCCRISPRRR
ncbi:MAG: hypothetical protein J2P48_03585 [Alphaproteobacteria bacterium]|nr:hypothetical protein [Alphaproteobacteria bacterium]